MTTSQEILNLLVLSIAKRGSTMDDAIKVGINAIDLHDTRQFMSTLGDALCELGELMEKEENDRHLLVSMN